MYQRSSGVPTDISSRVVSLVATVAVIALLRTWAATRRVARSVNCSNYSELLNNWVSDRHVGCARGQLDRRTAMAQRLDGEDHQCDPHQAEAEPAAGRHVLVEVENAERELQGRGEVLQQAQRHQRHPDGGAA